MVEAVRGSSPGRRLYYEDGFLREFDARVVLCEPDGARWRVMLDRTAFYPTSGGQPFDTGRIGTAEVADVIEEENGEIVHIVGQPLAIGPVHGAIDWARRFDHMQQHTAQHMLSAAFRERFQFETVSFHLGKGISTIDLAVPSLVPRHCEEAERRVNEVIFEDRPIRVRYGTAAELAAEGIRKKVEREGTWRVIDIEGFDRQPCGGTHLARTGQAGMLLVRRGQRQKRNWRVEFVAGFRALAAAREDLGTLRESAELIGCGMPELPVMIGRMQEERRVSQREAKKLTQQMAELEAAQLVATKTETSADGARRIIAHVSEDTPASYLALLAAKIVAVPNMQTILASRSAQAIVLAQSAGLEGDMGALLRELLARFGVKGGGSKAFAQGRLADAASVEAVIRAACERLLA